MKTNSFNAYVPPDRRGNPRLGREKKEEKAKRTKTFREMNALMKEASIHSPGAVLEALGVAHLPKHESSGGGHIDLGRMLDEQDNPSFWR